MSDPIALFGLVAPDHPDWSLSDQAAEFARYCERQRAIRDCLEGKRPPDEVLDMLAEHLVDVDAYLQEVSQNVAAVLNGQLIL